MQSTCKLAKGRTLKAKKASELILGTVFFFYTLENGAYKEDKWHKNMR